MRKATVTFYRSKKDNQWYWHLKQPNGRKTADGCEGYKTLAGARRGLQATIKKLANAKIIVNK